MTKFKVLCRVDAFVDYTAEIEADNAEAAATMARANPDAYAWAKQADQEFDARLYVTLDRSGVEIERTEVGDL